MKKQLILAASLFLFSGVFAFSISQASQYDFDTFNCNTLEEELIPHCESTKSFIRNCYTNPNNCDCSYFSEPEAQAECNKWVDEGIRLMAQKSQECVADLYSCSCKDLPHPRLVAVCESEKNKFMGKLRAMEQSCFSDPATCDCSIFESAQYIAKCEEEMGKASQIAASCMEDIGNCDCSSIANPVAREKCEENKAFYIDYENDFRANCEENFDECDCSTIPSISGQQACEAQKSKVLESAQSQVYAMIYECFKDINNCDCSKLQEQGYIDYCEETKNYGFACMQTGGMGCEQLDNIVLYPPSLPEFLRPYFAQTFKSFIDAEKLKGMAASAEIARTCVIDPHNCDCSTIPTYAREFCLDKKDMQIDCIEGNITACEALDNTINVVPLTAPKFVRDFLDPILRPLMLMQKEQIKGRYAEMVKEQMLACVENESNCDCDSVPLQYQSFCSNKISLIRECNAFNYSSCFRLMDEPNIPDDLPGFIRIFVEGSVNRQVEQRINAELGKNVDSIKEPIINCIINETNCDCSSVPEKYQLFCENKILSVNKCMNQDYDECFKLMEESPLPEDLPDRLKNLINAPVEREFNNRMNEAFLKIRPSVCNNMNLAQCMNYFNNNCQGLSPNACLKRN
ncbi:MAG: hypothetical protein PHG04_01530 [Candidatus Nanoarchaeia archaeon]|nr:hypothetical protein [Candidatus Nanoarchaeia archaeon]